MASVTVSVTLVATERAASKEFTTSSGKPYRVVQPDNGGSFCIFPKAGDDAAAKIVAALPKEGAVVLGNVGLHEGVLVYGDSTVATS